MHRCGSYESEKPWHQLHLPYVHDVSFEKQSVLNDVLIYGSCERQSVFDEMHYALLNDETYEQNDETCVLNGELIYGSYERHEMHYALQHDGFFCYGVFVQILLIFRIYYPYAF